MLDDFLETMGASPFEDGRNDCALTVADWVMAARGCPDPAHDLRGRYSSASGRMKVLKQHGGLKAVMQACADRAGLEPTRKPVRGDVGLVAIGKRACAAICLGTRWAAKGNGLVVETPSRVIAAWRV